MRKYGQHFLVNKGVIEKIVSCFIDNMEGAAVEIGPGKGALTQALLARGITPLTLFEIDGNMIKFLKQTLPAWAAFRIVEGDFLQTSSDNLPSGAVSFISNLPYISAGDILLKVLSLDNFKTAVFMFQREHAQRLMAKEETKNYGALSVLFQTAATAQSVCRVSAGSFSPAPKVDSEVLLIKPRAQSMFDSKKHRADFETLVTSAFSYRRKTILNSLCETYKKNKEVLGAALKASDIKISARAEEVPPRKYIALAKNLDGIAF